MQKRYLFYILAIQITGLTCFMCSASEQAAGLVTAVSTARSCALETKEGLVPLDTYNSTQSSTLDVTQDQKNIDITLVTQFLDKILRENKLNPERFTYSVATDSQDWQVRSMPGFADNNVVLVIPGTASSTASLISYFTRSTQLEPVHGLNIRDLDKLLSSKQHNQERIDQYSLAITKALVQAKTKGTFEKLTDMSVYTVLAYTGEAVAAVDANLKHLLTALATVYPYLADNSRYIEFQKNLDTQILNTHDLGLIKAHIADLEEQRVSQSSLINRVVAAYLPIAKDPLKERIKLLEDYVRDNEQELKMLPRFLKNQESKK